MYEPRFAEEVAARRAARLARMKRRRPYQLKPDLPGMTKRDRRFGYIGWAKTARSVRWERVRLLATGALRARKRPAKPPPLPRRELKPRPAQVRSNKRLYSRQHEHTRATFGRDGIGLLCCFYDLYVGWTYR